MSAQTGTDMHTGQFAAIQRWSAGEEGLPEHPLGKADKKSALSGEAQSKKEGRRVRILPFLPDAEMPVCGVRAGATGYTAGFFAPDH